ncbi:polysaccharide pyruvyl transferase family protein [Algihabitans albus]|uniref:polysaccharide pyruvyl transferase family protein n=1 Tax=Algihabitans albus TaxID=2164067 RepID=UPI000E5D89BD|nr:polysaccharide pyruvyl transferase family protein [Algihabitans albus]
MEIYHWNDRVSNFGDEINTWLWHELADRRWPQQPGTLFVGIGTVLDHQIPSSTKVYVFGAGAGYGPPKDIVGLGWQVYGVRGPITARLCGLTEEAVIGDPAMLLPDVFPVARPSQAAKRKVIYVPHVHSVANAPWQEVCDAADVAFIDPRRPSKTVVQEIASADLVLAEAMHAAIIADAYRVPWIPVWTSNRINALKWSDWSSSLNMTIEPRRIDPPSLLMLSDNFASKAAGFDMTTPFFDLKTRTFMDVDQMVKAQHRVSKLEKFKKPLRINYLRLRSIVLESSFERVWKQKTRDLTARASEQMANLSKEAGVLSKQEDFDTQTAKQRLRLDQFLDELSDYRPLDRTAATISE